MPTTVTQLQATIGADDTEIQKALQRIEASFAKMAASAEAAVEKLASKVEQEMPKIEKSAKDAGDKAGNALTRGFQKAWDAIGAGTMRAGKTLSLYVTLPLLALGKHALTVAGDFEQSMSILQVASGASQEQIKQLSALATDLGADLSIPAASASTAAAAMTELTKAGLNVKDTMASAKPTLLLAAAGMMDNAEAAQQLGMVLNQFALDGTQAYRVANLLAGAGKNVTGGVKGMTEALTHSGTAFRTLQIPIKDAVTVLALMARNGFVGETAGTQLKTALLRLAAASKDAKTPAHELAQELFNLSTGQMKPMAEVVGILHQKLGLLSPRQQAIIGGALGGVRAFQALAIIARYTGKEFTDLGNNINRTGQLEQEAKAKTDNVKGALVQLQSALDTALNSALKPFMGDIKRFLQNAADAIVSFTKWSDTTKKFTVALVAAVAMAGPTLIFLANLKTAIMILMPLFTAARTAALGLWAAIGGPATIAIGIVIGLVTLLVVAWKRNWGHIQEFTKAVWDELVDLFKTSAHSIQLIWSGLIDYLHLKWAQGTAKIDTAIHQGTRGFMAHFQDELDASKEDELYRKLDEMAANLKKKAAAATAAVNDNLKPGFNDPNLDLSGKPAKTKEDEHGKQYEQFQDALADATARLTEAQVKLKLAQKGASEAMQEAAGKAIDLRHQYNLLSAKTVQPLIDKNNKADSLEKQVDGLNKYRDKVRETQQNIRELTFSEKVHTDRLADLKREYPAITDAQAKFLDGQIQWQKHLQEVQPQMEKVQQGLRDFKARWMEATTNAPEQKAAVELFGDALLKVNPDIQDATELFAMLTAGEQGAAKAWVEWTRRIKDADLAAELKHIQTMHNTTQFKPGTLTPMFTQEQRFAMERAGKGYGDLTKAEKDYYHQLFINGQEERRNKVYLDHLDQSVNDLNDAWAKAQVALEDANTTLRVQATHSAVARFAWEKYHIELGKANKKTQDLITSAYGADAATKSMDELAGSVSSLFANAFANVKGGFKGMFDSILSGVDDLLTQIAAKFVAAQLTQLLFSLIPGGTNFLSSLVAGGNSQPGTHRALGGSVQPGSSYIVGENGPEMFVPSGPGRIVSARETKQMVAGGVTMHVTINTPDAQSFVQSRSTIQTQLALMADAARRRNGG